MIFKNFRLKFAETCEEPKQIVLDQKRKDLIVSIVNTFIDSLHNEVNEEKHVSWDPTQAYLSDAGSKQCAMKKQKCQNSDQNMATWSGKENSPDMKRMIEHSLNFWFEKCMENKDKDE